MEFVPHLPSSASGVGLQQMHGVASRIAPSATAFPHRAEQYDFLILSQWSDATDSDRNIEWTNALFQAMQPHLEASVYVNNLGDEGPGAGQGGLRAESLAPGCAQENPRPGQPVPGEPKHRSITDIARGRQ